MRDTRHFLILDANTLIDYCKSDRTIIKLICRHVGQIYLAGPVLDEINQIDECGCSELGIILVQPELEQWMLAAEENGPLPFQNRSLSLQDKICLILARDNGWTCVTNDVPLRCQCELAGVPLIWGIELICILVESGGLPAQDAKNIILEIQRNNPKYITDNIIKRAFERLGV